MNDLEELFNREPPYSEADLAKIIAHFRETRQAFLTGGKPKRAEVAKNEKIDLASLGLAAPKPVQKISLGGKK